MQDFTFPKTTRRSTCSYLPLHEINVQINLISARYQLKYLFAKPTQVIMHANYLIFELPVGAIR